MMGSYIADIDSILAGDADVVFVDVEGELQGAGHVGDGVHGGVPQHLTDAVCLVSWLPCIMSINPAINFPPKRCII